MKVLHQLIKLYLPIASLLVLLSCYPDESLNVAQQPTPESIRSELDQYIEDNFTKPYNIAVRYRFVDRFISPGERVTPPRLETIRPMLDFIEEFWIEPFLAVENGEAFFKDHVPSEVVFLGGLIFQSNGTVILGRAEAGARITFTDVNSIDPTNIDWVRLQLQTVYHEFAHIVHQRYKLPNAYETISPQGYTSAGSWFVLSDNEALERGFVSPYGTSSPNEDYAELIAFYLFEPFFNETFIAMEPNCFTPDCELRNQGRLLLGEKLNSIRSHFLRVTGVDLDEVRAEVQSRLF